MSVDDLVGEERSYDGEKAVDEFMNGNDVQGYRWNGEEL